MSEITFRVMNSDVIHQTRTCKDHLSATDKQRLLKDGYIQLPYRMPEFLVRSLYASIKRLLPAPVEELNSTYTSKKFAGFYIREPQMRDLAFIDVLNAKYPYVDIVRSLMGPRISIRSYSIRITTPGSGDGTCWHTDQRSFVTPRPHLFTEPHVLTLAVYLDPVTEESGKLYLRPGSHRLPAQPSEDDLFRDFDDQVELLLDPGEGVLFHSALWHRGGPNNSDWVRRILIVHFIPVFCRRAEYELIEPSAEYLDYLKQLRESGDEAHLELLGYPGLKYPLFM